MILLVEGVFPAHQCPWGCSLNPVWVLCPGQWDEWVHEQEAQNPHTIAGRTGHRERPHVEGRREGGLRKQQDRGVNSFLSTAVTKCLRQSLYI